MMGRSTKSDGSGRDAWCARGPRCCNGRTCPISPNGTRLLGFVQPGSFSTANLLGVIVGGLALTVQRMPVLLSVLTARRTSVLAMGPCTLLTPRVSSCWKTVLSAGQELRAAPSLGANGTVYIGSENGTFYAVDSSTGVIKWEFATGKGIEAPALVDGRDNVYVASLDSKVYVLSPSGALFSTFETGDEIVAAMALGADGTLYVGSKDHGIYALEEGDPTAAEAATAAATAVAESS